MRKFAFHFAVLLTFALAAWSQQPASSDPQASSPGQTSASPQDMGSAQQSAPSHHDKSSGKEHSVTGCLSGPNAEGAYELTSGKHKVELSGNDELKNHVGHKVTVTGNWTSASEMGETHAAASKGEKSEKGEKHMKVDSLKMVSESCEKASASAPKSY
jgi:hypothetical protein